MLCLSLFFLIQVTYWQFDILEMDKNDIREVNSKTISLMTVQQQYINLSTVYSFRDVSSYPDHKFSELLFKKGHRVPL